MSDVIVIVKMLLPSDYMLSYIYLYTLMLRNTSLDIYCTFLVVGIFLTLVNNQILLSIFCFLQYVKHCNILSIYNSHRNHY